MNKAMIIGNLTRDPEMKTMADGTRVVTFTVAVSRRTNKAHPEADYFRVTAWRTLGELCYKYLAKGRKVMVEGSMRASAWLDNSGTAKAGLEVTASAVEFLTPRGQQAEKAAPAPESGGFVEVEDEDMPF